MKRITALIFALLLTLTVVSCKSEEKTEEEGLVVVASIFPEYDFARAILGEKGSAKLLLSPGADSHSFEIKPSDMNLINGSDLFIYTGSNMEIWVDGILPSIDKSVKVVDMSAASVDVADEHGHSDPHIWTSPVIARKMLSIIYEAICEIDSENSEIYKSNYEKYDELLVSLDEEFREIAADAADKTLYFSGAFAFAHFTEEYGFSYCAPFNSCSDVQLESVAAVNTLITEMKESGAKYVFYQELSNDSILSTVTAETGAVPLQLHSVHNVSREDFNNGVTYVSLMEQNAENLRKALCDDEAS